MHRQIQIAFGGLHVLRFAGAQQRHHVEMAAHALEQVLALAGLAADRFQRRFKARQCGRGFAAQQQHDAGEELRQCAVHAFQVARRVGQLSAQDRMLGQRQAQRIADDMFARDAALEMALCIAAHQRRQRGFALRVLEQQHQHIVLQQRMHQQQHARLEGAGEDVDDRMQLGRFVAHHAGGQQGHHFLRRTPAQQGHAQARHAMPVAARLIGAVPVLPHRVERLMRLAQLIEHVGADGGADGGPAQLGVAHVAARRDHAGEGQAFQLDQRIVQRHHREGLAVHIVDAGLEQLVEDGRAADGIAHQCQQGENQLLGEFERVELRQQRITHQKLSITTGAATSLTGRPKMRW